MTTMNGLEDLGAGYEMDAYAPIDALAEDYEFFGLDQFISMPMLQSMGIAVASGAGGVLATMNVLDRVEYFADKPVGRALAEIGVGILGGRLLWQVNKDAAMGFAGGVGGYGLMNVVNYYLATMGASSVDPATMPPTSGMGYTEVDTVPSYRKLDRVSVPANWGGGRAPMSGLGRDLVTRADYQQINGDVGGENLSTWIS